MPIWVLILIISLCFTCITGTYLLRQNGRNGHRNGNGNGHKIVQMKEIADQNSGMDIPAMTQKKMKRVINKIKEEKEEGLKYPGKTKKLPTEEPHEHSEHHDDPPTALRERRRPLVRTREDEEEGEEGEDDELQLLQPELSSAPEALPAPNKVMAIENGTQEEWRHDENVVDTLIVKKNGETQATVLQEDKGVDAHPEMRDEEVQNSPVKDSLTTQAIPQTRDIGTGEWLAFQRSIGVGNHIDVEDKSVDLRLETAEKGTGYHLETEDKAIHVRPEQEDKSIQEEPEKESKGVGSYPASLHDKSLQVRPDVADKSLQESREHLSIGIGTDKKELRHQSLQILPSLQDKSIQKDISRVSVGIQNFNVFGEDKSIQAQEERISISLSSLPKLKPFFFSEEEKFDLSKSLALSLSGRASKNFLDDIQTVKSEILLSPKARSVQEDEIEKPFFHPIIQKKKSFHIEDIPLEVSIYPSVNKSLVMSEVIENSFLEKSRLLSLKKSKSYKDIEDMSFELLDKSPKLVKKKLLDDLSFEIIEKASRKSSFSIIKSEEEM